METINLYIVLFLVIVLSILVFATPSQTTTLQNTTNTTTNPARVTFSKGDDVRIIPPYSSSSQPAYPQTKFSNDVKINNVQTPTTDLDQVYKATVAKKIVPMDNPFSKPF